MLLTIDIGNSLTKFAVFEGESIISRGAFKTDSSADAQHLKPEFDAVSVSQVDGISVSSVVTELRGAYQLLGSNHFNCEPQFIDHDSDLGFTIDYIPPEDCGPDRLVAASAAVALAGYPVIVCDFGTATTIDLVDSNKIYRGGVIAPGMRTMADSLFEKTSKLPRVEIGMPENVIGDSTVESIRSGVYFGYTGLVDGIVSRIQAGLERPVPVISTGGFARLISESSEYAKRVERDLVHQGLRQIWDRSNGAN